MPESKSMATRRTGQCVRLLTRRTGIHRMWGDNPLMEIAEVFRIDVVGQAFGFEDIVYRVTFVVTQEEEPALQERYPFELPELEDTVQREPHDQRLAKYVHKAVFENCGPAQGFLIKAWSGEYPNLHNSLQEKINKTDVGQWELVTPAEFFTQRHLSDLAEEVQDQGETYTEGLLMVINDILVSYPDWFFGILPMITDLQNLTAYWTWLKGGRRGQPRLLSEGSGAHTPAEP